MNMYWFQGYVACVIGELVNPYEHDAHAQAWEDGFNAAFREMYHLVM
jgi:hypothetical protein